MTEGCDGAKEEAIEIVKIKDPETEISVVPNDNGDNGNNASGDTNKKEPKDEEEKEEKAVKPKTALNRNPDCLYHGASHRNWFQQLLNLIRGADFMPEKYVSRVGSVICSCKLPQGKGIKHLNLLPLSLVVFTK